MSRSNVFPSNPINGQEYIDDFGIRWVFDAIENEWVKFGVPFDIPVARSGDQCAEED